MRPTKELIKIPRDFRGLVHHIIIHTEIANKMQQCIKMYYSMFICSSKCFGRHTVHHQKFQTALAASGFAYVKGCWTLRLLDSVQQSQHPTTSCWIASSKLNVQEPPDDGRCVARNILSFIQTWNNKF